MTTISTTVTVDGQSAPFIEPLGGYDRLAESGVDLDPDKISEWRRMHAPGSTKNLPVLTAFPVSVSVEGNVYAVGRCPLCKRLHGHGIGGGFLRRPHCSDNIAPFGEGHSKPDKYLVRFVIDVAPDDIRRELDPSLDRRDLLHIADLAGGRTRWERSHTRTALKALLRCGALDSAIRKAQREGAAFKDARRTVLAHAIHKHGPGPMRRRLRDALFAAYFAAGQPAK
jgi:hypothetical protein